MAGNSAFTGRDQQAFALLSALRQAGCNVWLEAEPDDTNDRGEDMLIVSPPARHVEWDGDAEDAIETFYYELKALLRDEDSQRHFRFF